MKEIFPGRKDKLAFLGLVGLLVVCVRSERLPQVSPVLATGLPVGPTAVVPEEKPLLPSSSSDALVGDEGFPAQSERMEIRRGQSFPVEKVKLPRGLMLATSSGKNLEFWRAEPEYAGKLFARLDLTILAQGGLTVSQEAEWVGREWDVKKACAGADVLVLAGGWNDALLEESPTQMQVGFESFYDRAVALCPEGITIVVLGPPPMSGRDRHYVANLFKIVDFQREFVALRGGIFIDLVPILSEKRRLGELADGFKKDDDHVNGAALMKVSEEVERVLRVIGKYLSR